MTTIQEQLNQIELNRASKVEQIIIFADPRVFNLPDHPYPVPIPRGSLGPSYGRPEGDKLSPEKVIQIVSLPARDEELDLSRFNKITSLIIEGGQGWIGGKYSCWELTTIKSLNISQCYWLESIDFFGFHLTGKLDLTNKRYLKSARFSRFFLRELKLSERYDHLYNFDCDSSFQSYLDQGTKQKVEQLQQLAQERSKDRKAYEELRARLSWYGYLKMNRQTRQSLEQKEQENQNYLVRIRELEEQNALLQQQLAESREIQEITTNLENQGLEENSERQLGTELTAQIRNITLW